MALSNYKLLPLTRCDFTKFSQTDFKESKYVKLKRLYLVLSPDSQYLCKISSANTGNKNLTNESCFTKSLVIFKLVQKNLLDTGIVRNS